MAAQTTASALAPEVEHSHASLNEPSMEDILASIRRIIAEDQSSSLGRIGLGGLTRRAQAPAPTFAIDAETKRATIAEAPVTVAEVLEEPLAVPPVALARHTFEMPVQEPSPPIEEVSVGPHGEAYDEAAPIDASPDEVAYDPNVEPGLVAKDNGGEPLMSPATGASISSSFQTLAETVMLQDPDLIERVLRDSMRPLLKVWLDDHLPSIVERLVRSEIERVARGGRGRTS